ncbi:hypothetical protein GQ473_02375, partial [archaeon]|nr:hypothetical protein [archaeon]
MLVLLVVMLFFFITFSSSSLSAFAQVSKNQSIHFSSNDNISFDISKTKINPVSSLMSLSTMSSEDSENSINVVLKNSDGILINDAVLINKTSNLNYTLSIDNQNLVPGQYVMSVDYGEYVEEYWFTYGLVSVNTKKSIYRPGETAEIIMVVLDKYGYLSENVDVVLHIVSPKGFESTYSTEYGTIIENSSGIYVVDYVTDEVGNYSLFVTANASNVLSDTSSYFMVSEFYEFDILREVPATIAPELGPFDSYITVYSYVDDSTFSLEEQMPLVFDIVSTDADRVIEGNRKTLVWDNLTNGSVVYYSAEVPHVWPYLYELGTVEIEYFGGTFIEARPWFFAIDPPPRGIYSYVGVDVLKYAVDDCTGIASVVCSGITSGGSCNLNSSDCYRMEASVSCSVAGGCPDPLNNVYNDGISNIYGAIDIANDIFWTDNVQDSSPPPTYTCEGDCVGGSYSSGRVTWSDSPTLSSNKDDARHVYFVETGSECTNALNTQFYACSSVGCTSSAQSTVTFNCNDITPPTIVMDAAINDTLLGLNDVVKWSVSVTDGPVNVYFQNNTANKTALSGVGDEWYITETCISTKTENWNKTYVNDSSGNIGVNNSVGLSWNCDIDGPNSYSVAITGKIASDWLVGGETLTCIGAVDVGAAGVDATGYSYQYTTDDAGAVGWSTISGAGCTTSSCAWDTSLINDATTWVRCVANDTLSNQGSYSSLSYAGVDNTAPNQCDMDDPLGGAEIISTPYTFSSLESDAHSGIKNVTFEYYDSGWIVACSGAESATSYNCSWAVPGGIEDRTDIQVRAICYDNVSISNTSSSQINIVIDVSNQKPVSLLENVVSVVFGNYELNATLSYDNDPIDDVLNYEFIISNQTDFSTYFVVCSGVPSTCDWDTTATIATCSDSSLCYVMVNVIDERGLENSSVYQTTTIDNSPPVVSSLTPLSNSWLVSGVGDVECVATDAVDASPVYNIDMYYDGSWHSLC